MRAFISPQWFSAMLHLKCNQKTAFVSNWPFNESSKKPGVPLRYNNWLLGVLLHANEALSQFTLSPRMSLARHYNIFLCPKTSGSNFYWYTFAHAYVRFCCRAVANQWGGERARWARCRPASNMQIEYINLPRSKTSGAAAAAISSPFLVVNVSSNVHCFFCICI